MRHKHAPTRTCKGMEVDEHRLILRSTGETRNSGAEGKERTKGAGVGVSTAKAGQERANSALVLKVHTVALIFGYCTLVATIGSSRQKYFISRAMGLPLSDKNTTNAMGLPSCRLAPPPQHGMYHVVRWGGIPCWTSDRPVGPCRASGIQLRVHTHERRHGSYRDMVDQSCNTVTKK